MSRALAPPKSILREGILRQRYARAQVPAAIYGRGQTRLDCVLNERALNGDTDSQVDALMMEQQVQVVATKENIKQVMSKGGAMRMERAAVRLSKGENRRAFPVAAGGERQLYMGGVRHWADRSHDQAP